MTFLIILITIAVCYLGYCCYLHKKEKVVFFYSYFDVAITTIYSAVMSILLYLTNANTFDPVIVKNIIFYFSIIAVTAIWIVTYRSNSGKFFPTLFVVLAKVFFGTALLVLIVMLYLRALVLSSTERKKYEWRRTRARINAKNWVAAIVFGVGVVRFIADYCCLYSDFSIPEKVHKMKGNY